MIETLRYVSHSRDLFHAVLVKNPRHFREIDAAGNLLTLAVGDILFLHTLATGLEETGRAATLKELQRQFRFLPNVSEIDAGLEEFKQEISLMEEA